MTNDSSISVKSPDCFNKLLSTTTVQCLFLFGARCSDGDGGVVVVIVVPMCASFRFRIYRRVIKNS